MAKFDIEKPNIYLIPVNFIDESRFLNGMFRTRNFVEGAIMGGVVAIAVWLLISAPFQVKISMVTGLAFPFFMLGVSGINGDALSTFLHNALTWVRTRGTMLYNNETRALAQAPLASMMEEEGMNDKLIDILDAWKEKSQKKRLTASMVEGRDFVFAKDADLAGKHLDEVEAQEDESDAPKLAKKKSRQQAAKVPAQEDGLFRVEVREIQVSVEQIQVTSAEAGSDEEEIDLLSETPAQQADDQPQVCSISSDQSDQDEDGELF